MVLKQIVNLLVLQPVAIKIMDAFIVMNYTCYTKSLLNKKEFIGLY